MGNKKLVAGIIVLAASLICAIPFMIKKENSAEVDTKEHSVLGKEVSSQKISAKKHKVDKKQEKQKEELSANSEEENRDIKVDLYSDSTSMPISAIAVVSELPEPVKNAVKHISESQENIFMAKKTGDKLLLIIENQNNIRHGVEFIEISKNGHKTHSALGYTDKMQDSDNDTWEYDKASEVPIPVKHIKYDNNGEVEFIETWNYGDEPIKYEMKNAEGKTLSLRKETMDNDSELRVEHLIYDKNGKTKVNVSATYEGPDVKRFTYYNADKPAEGISVFSEFSDGIKTKESVYSSDLKLEKVYTSDYKDGVRSEITVLDPDNNVIETLTGK